MVATGFGVGGAERVFESVARGLSENGHSVDLCALYYTGAIGTRLQEDGFHLHSPMLRSRTDVAGLGRLMGFLRRNRYDVVYIMNLPVIQLWFPLFARMAGASVVSALHYTERSQRKSRTATINRLTSPLTDCFIAISKTQRDHVCAQQRLDPARVAVILNGIDCDASPHGPVAGSSLRDELGIGQDEFVVGMVARLSPEKNHALFLRMASTLVRDGVPARFLLAGGGPLREDLVAQAEESGLSDRVTFLGIRDDVARVVEACDVGVLSSNAEALPMSLLEFMAGGRPVVSTDVGGVREILDDAGAGIIVPADDVEALASAVAGFALDPSLGRTMGAEGRRRVAALFSRERMVRDTEQLLEGLVTARGRRGDRVA